jgi:molybdopterin molybdotransferase
MMDGFALRSADVAGASSNNRLPLAVVGQALPGHPFSGQVEAGQAVRIMTGGPLPAGADAVVPVEWVELEGSRIQVSGDLPLGKHVGQRGEDVRQGDVVLKAGRRLRPQDVGLLASIGLGQVQVMARVRTRIIVTGDELLPVGSVPRDFHIVDSNSPMLGGLLQRDGGIVVDVHLIPDAPAAILPAMRQEADVVLVSGGSSVGQEDHAPRLLADHGTLAIHGIAMRPSSPAGMGILDQRLVFLLPGNPVSCLCAYDFFAGRAIRAAAGLGPEMPYRRVKLPLCRKLVSVAGRLDYARVAITEDGVEPIAISGASVLSSTSRASGFVIVPDDSEGYPAAAEVEVFLYDETRGIAHGSGSVSERH